MFPRFVRQAYAAARGDGRAVTVLRALHRICRVYTLLGVLVPVFGFATAASLGVLGDAWLIISVVLTGVAAVVLAVVVLPGQRDAIEAIETAEAGATPGPGSENRSGSRRPKGRRPARHGVRDLQLVVDSRRRVDDRSAWFDDRRLATPAAVRVVVGVGVGCQVVSSRAAEGSPVGRRAGADQPFELLAEGRRRTEADLPGDLVDRMRGGLEQELRPAKACTVQPLQRCRPGLLAEPAVQRPSAARPPAVPCRPGRAAVAGCRASQRSNGSSEAPSGAGGSRTMNCACPPSRSSGITDSAGGVGSGRGTVITAHHVQAQVQAGRGAGRGQDLAVVDVQHVRVDGHGRMTGGQLRGGSPVGRRAQPVQQAGGGQGERADADGGDPTARLRRRPQRLEHVVGQFGCRVLAPRARRRCPPRPTRPDPTAPGSRTGRRRPVRSARRPAPGSPAGCRGGQAARRRRAGPCRTLPTAWSGRTGSRCPGRARLQCAWRQSLGIRRILANATLTGDLPMLRSPIAAQSQTACEPARLATLQSVPHVDG